MTSPYVNNDPTVTSEVVELGEYFQSYLDASDALDQENMDGGSESVQSAADNLRYAVWYYFQRIPSHLTYKQVLLTAVMFFSLYYDPELPRFVSLVVANLNDWLQADSLPETDYIDPFKETK